MIAAGLDPGKQGGIVIVESEGPALVVREQIMLDALGDGWWTPQLMAETLRSLPMPDRVGLEQVQIRPGQGGQMWTAIRWGYLHAACCYAWPGASMWTPTASAWMGSALKDQPGTGKDRAVALVSSELPWLDLTPGRRRKPHDGLADAGALALWALRRRG